MKEGTQESKVFATISTLGQATAGDVANRLGITRPIASAVISALEKKGVVRKIGTVETELSCGPGRKYQCNVGNYAPTNAEIHVKPVAIPVAKREDPPVQLDTHSMILDALDFIAEVDRSLRDVLARVEQDRADLEKYNKLKALLK